MISTDEDCFIACCMNFLYTSVKTSGLERLNPSLKSNCFYFNDGFDSDDDEDHDDDDDDDVSSCITTIFDKQNINYFCFHCQKIILVGFSKELHCIACRMTYSF